MEPKDPKARVPVAKLTSAQKRSISAIAAEHFDKKWTDDEWQIAFLRFQLENPLCLLNQTNFRQRVQRLRPSGVKHPRWTADQIKWIKDSTRDKSDHRWHAEFSTHFALPKEEAPSLSAFQQKVRHVLPPKAGGDRLMLLALAAKEDDDVHGSGQGGAAAGSVEPLLNAGSHNSQDSAVDAALDFFFKTPSPEGL